MTVNMRMVVTHVHSGKQWIGEWIELESEDEFQEAMAAVRENLSDIHYLGFGNITIPGDFIRNHCIIEFEMSRSV